MQFKHQRGPVNCNQLFDRYHKIDIRDNNFQKATKREGNRADEMDREVSKQAVKDIFDIPDKDEFLYIPCDDLVQNKGENRE